MFNRAIFFDAIRKPLFGGKLRQSQVDGLERFLAEAERRKTPVPWLAYILATVLHETARTFQPIAEYGKGKGREYGKPDPQTGKVYYGRGYVQLTWKENYAKAGRVLRVDLVSTPDLAMQPDHAVRITFQGMEEGWFAGDRKGRHTLARHLDWVPPNYVEARRIINGTDKNATIATYAIDFEQALRRAQAAPDPRPQPQPHPAAPVIPAPPDVEPVDPGSTAAVMPLRLKLMLGAVILFLLIIGVALLWKR